MGFESLQCESDIERNQKTGHSAAARRGLLTAFALKAGAASPTAQTESY